MLHGKPTVVLGNPWYSGQGLTIDVAQLPDLPEAIERALSFTPSRDRLLNFLGQYRHLIHQGVYGLPEPGNVASIARALLAHATSPARPSRDPGENREQALSGAGGPAFVVE